MTEYDKQHLEERCEKKPYNCSILKEADIYNENGYEQGIKDAFMLAEKIHPGIANEVLKLEEISMSFLISLMAVTNY